MTLYTIFRCTSALNPRGCKAELRVPRADADKYPSDWKCDACASEEMAEAMLARQEEWLNARTAPEMTEVETKR